MIIVLYIFLFILGFAALIKGADFFVDGSSSLARTLKVPSLIIGLTVVAMGTSAPELAVSTTAAIKEANELALSNVVGSNLFNLLVVLGFCAVIRPLLIEKSVLKRDYPFMIGITVLVFGAAGFKVLTSLGSFDFLHTPVLEDVGMLTRPFCIVLLVLFAAYIAMLIILAKKNKREDDGDEIKQLPLWKSLLLIVGGLALIVGGGQVVVYSAKEVARTFGMSETLIGLTVVALGTSLPELVTSVVASRKGENELAVGNVVGSNIFNLLLILGVSGTVHPIAVNYASLIDLGILIIASVATLIFSVTKKINRAEGIIMLLIYSGTITFAILR